MIFVERYPSLSLIFGGKNGFNPTDLSVQKSMEILHTELTDLNSTENKLKVKDPVSHKPISHVRVPKTYSDQSPKIQKSGSMSQSKLLVQNITAPSKPPTTLPFTSSDFY